jgi:hypothetical protein
MNTYTWNRVEGSLVSDSAINLHTTIIDTLNIPISGGTIPEVYLIASSRTISLFANLSEFQPEPKPNIPETTEKILAGILDGNKVYTFMQPTQEDYIKFFDSSNDTQFSVINITGL